MKKNICVISSFGIQTYDEIYEEKKSFINRDFFNYSIFKDNHLLDVVGLHDFIENNGKLNIDFDKERHIYVNGIVIGNYFHRLGYNVDVINRYKEDLETNRKIKNADEILISTTFACGKWSDHLTELINGIKKMNDTARIFIGGPGLYRLKEEGKRSIKYIEQIKEANPDYMIFSRNGLKEIQEIIESNPQKNDKCEFIIDDEPGIFAQPEDYRVDWMNDEMQSPHNSLLASYGCAHSCAFCIYKFLNKTVKYMPVDVIKRTIDNMADNRKVPLTYLRFADECFNEPKSRAIEVCDYLRDNYPDLKFTCFIRGDQIDEELVKALKDGGCTMVSIGVESGDQRMQKIMNKNLDLKKFKNSIKLLKDNGIATVFSMLIGFYGENEESIQNTMNFLQDLKPDLVRLNIWTLAPGEENTELAKKYHLKFSDKVTGWSHDTMNQREATEYAMKMYKELKNITFLPPFTSVFDQWPQLAAKNMTNKQILKYFGIYHKLSIGELEMPKGLTTGHLEYEKKQESNDEER